MTVPIGIDLGTTFSSIACYKYRGAEIIPDQQGQRLVPSVVYVDPNTGEISVGNIAYDLSSQCPENLLRDAKRFLGRNFNDKALEKFIRPSHRLYSLVRDENDKVAFEITVSGQKVIKKPEEVSAEVLKYLKKMAEDYLGKNVEEAVISIPAYFSNGQRKATVRAAELAGLNVIKLITEPVAAALHYVRSRRWSFKVMVFDWGGGTLDISFINVSKDKLEVEAIYGDTLLGGRNIDENLIKHNFTPNKKNRSKYMRTLLQHCIRLKEHLSVKQQFNILMDDDLSIDINRNKFEEINNEIFEQAMDIVKYGLKDLNYEPSTIKKVLLVGGSTRIPKIKELLSTIFGKHKIKTDLNPDEAVAAGASIQAASLRRRIKDLEKFEITEVTPLSLGIHGHGDLFTNIIKKNSKLPASKTLNWETVENNQLSATFNIVEGERKNCKYNNKLTCLTLEGLPQKRAGDVKFVVTFNLDEDGILTVTASETSTGNTNRLSFTMSEFRLSESKIKFKIEDAEAAKLEDDVFETFVIYRSSLTKKCRRISFELNDTIMSDADRQMIKDECNQFLQFAEDLDFTEIDTLKRRVNYFNNLVIMKKYKLTIDEQ